MDILVTSLNIIVGLFLIACVVFVSLMAVLYIYKVYQKGGEYS